MKKNKWLAALFTVAIAAVVLGGCSLLGNNNTAPITYNLNYNESEDYLIGVADKALKSMVEIRSDISSSKSAAGSGVIIATDPGNNLTYIITNNHVVKTTGTNSNVYDKDVKKINVLLAGGNRNTGYVTATLLKSTGSDAASDLALISIPYSESHIPAVYSAEELSFGQHILAVGNGLDYGTSVCDGIVSNPSITIDSLYFKNTVIQISAPINSGNSGGGLFDMRGNLVGINTLKAVVSTSGDTTVYADNISFSLKMSHVKSFVDSYNTTASKKVVMNAYSAS